MDIIICTTARTDAEAKALLKRLRLPLRQLTASPTEGDDMAKTSIRREEQAPPQARAKHSRRSERALKKAIDPAIEGCRPEERFSRRRPEAHRAAAQRRRRTRFAIVAN